MKPISLVPLTIAFSGWDPEAFKEEFALVRSNGLQFAYLEAGKAGAPLVLCLHGFPDDAFSFAELLPALAAQGYRAVALFNRGYYPTEIPSKADYSMETLARDSLELIDSFGAGEAIIIGHDWGAFAGYVAANLAPERVKKLVTLSIPHPRVGRAEFQTTPRFLDFRGARSQRRFAENHFKYLDDTFAKWSPTWTGPVPEAQCARMKLNLARPGRTAAALGYFRSFRKDMLNPRRRLLYKKKTSVPTLTIYGELDGAIPETSYADTSQAFTGPYRLVEIPDVGHFVHLEATELVNSEILKFLGPV